ncbi:hypothetical protein GGS23DRAFT_41170 [Durotheca rogersii]|uniref:uncharacterized protein n=1 Tax=Durotheca rogersii TaxID=419775 RepID=UPI00221F9158|nr:uncharacterized protein GGS23DRAFT_41170 [Durotheca rogersii]KAI5868631.1 hypothetical protein GGS23DRAFT_41170 [Durotheca rogersii]
MNSSFCMFASCPTPTRTHTYTRAHVGMCAHPYNHTYIRPYLYMPDIAHAVSPLHAAYARCQLLICRIGRGGSTWALRSMPSLGCGRSGQASRSGQSARYSAVFSACMLPLPFLGRWDQMPSEDLDVGQSLLVSSRDVGRRVSISASLFVVCLRALCLCARTSVYGRIYAPRDIFFCPSYLGAMRRMRGMGEGEGWGGGEPPHSMASHPAGTAGLPASWLAMSIAELARTKPKNSLPNKTQQSIHGRLKGREGEEKKETAVGLAKPRCRLTLPTFWVKETRVRLNLRGPAGVRTLAPLFPFPLGLYIYIYRHVYVCLLISQQLQVWTTCRNVSARMVRHPRLTSA